MPGEYIVDHAWGNPKINNDPFTIVPALVLGLMLQLATGRFITPRSGPTSLKDTGIQTACATL
jgi:hypothetical protein